MACRKSPEHLNIGKIAIGNIFKDVKNLRRSDEFFVCNYEKRRHGKYHEMKYCREVWLKHQYKHTSRWKSSLKISYVNKKWLDKEQLSDFLLRTVELKSGKKLAGSCNEIFLWGEWYFSNRVASRDWVFTRVKLIPFRKKIEQEKLKKLSS